MPAAPTPSPTSELARAKLARASLAAQASVPDAEYEAQKEATLAAQGAQMDDRRAALPDMIAALDERIAELEAQAAAS